LLSWHAENVRVQTKDLRHELDYDSASECELQRIVTHINRGISINT